MGARTTTGTLPAPVDLGSGKSVVILPGFAMRPWTYLGTARELSAHCRVLVPDVYAPPGHWVYREVVEALARTLDSARMERVSLVGHSFGGAVELGFAARFPDRVEELVFVDTLALSREWVLAREATAHPFHALRMATPSAALAFASSWISHGRQLLEAAWWGFTSGRLPEIGAIVEAGIRSHVLWANRDSLLSRSDGRAFARELGATFTLAECGGGVVDHDWMFRHPKLFVAHLEMVALNALAEALSLKIMAPEGTATLRS